MKIDGNGKNEFCIIIKSPHPIFNDEWLELLIMINKALEDYRDGFFSGTSAYLEEIK